MRIDGKKLAEHILNTVRARICSLRVTPVLAVVQIGNNPASLVYIRQKHIAAKKIGARIIISNTISDVDRFNNDPEIHGIIVQRPVPPKTPEYAVTLKKDVDGFEKKSPFDVPVALAVSEIIRSVRSVPKTYAVIGRGETAGGPIFRYLQKHQCKISLIHSQTKNPDNILKNADCVISCVGKKQVIHRQQIKPGAILIGVGIWKDPAGRLHGDYEEAEIADTAYAYTPTPGGVGPVNVACLMQNLVEACKIHTGR